MGKGGWCIGLTTLPTSCAACDESLEPQTPGNLRACPGTTLKLTHIKKINFLFSCAF